MTSIEETKPARHTYLGIISIAGPIIIGHLAENIINITDTIFVGRLGEQPLGAVGFGSLYYYTFVLMAMGLSTGVQILVGRRNGEKKYDIIGSLLDNALYTFIAVGLILFLILQAVSPYLVPFFLKSGTITDLTMSFVNIRQAGLIFVCLTFVFRAFYIGVAHTRVIIYITIASAAINVFFNQVLIFGHLGFQPMGIRGSATASVIADGCSALGYFIYSLLHKGNKVYRLFHFRKPDFGVIKQFLNIGIPLMLQRWVSVSSWLVFFIFIEKMGERALSVSAIIKSIYVVMMVPVWGIDSAANTLVSNAMGAGRTGEVTKIIRRCVLINVLVILVVVQANIFFPTAFLSIFNKNADLVADTIGPLRMITIGLLVFSVSGVLFESVTGTGATRISLYIELVTLALYFGYVGACLYYHGSITTFWASEVVYMASMGLWSFLYLATGKWKKVKV